MSWSELPADILCMIARKTASHADFVCFRCVCRSWRSVIALARSPHRATARFLSLALPSRVSSVTSPFPPFRSHDDHAPFRFFLLFDRSVHAIDLLPAPTRKCFCFGATHGLLALFNSQFDFFVLNVFTGETLPLPQPQFPGVLEVVKAGDERCPVVRSKAPLSVRIRSRPYPLGLGLHSYALKKLVLSSDISAADCVVLSLSQGLDKPVYCKLGDSSWTVLSCKARRYSDALCYKGQFYVLDYMPRLYVCDTGAASVMRQILFQPGWHEVVSKPFESIDCVYLVECYEDLLMVIRGVGQQSTNRMKLLISVFRVELGVKDARLIEVKDIGYHAIFVGLNTSFSLSLCDCDYLKENCVYLSDYRPGYFGKGVADYGIYKLADGSIEHVRCENDDFPPKWQRSVWINPC